MKKIIVVFLIILFCPLYASGADFSALNKLKFRNKKTDSTPVQKNASITDKIKEKIKGKETSTEIQLEKTVEKEETDEGGEIQMKKTFPRNVLAPAVQFEINDYKDYFLKPSDYEINLKSRNNYLITCKEDIIGINWGDLENIKMYDVKDEFTGANNMKSAVIKVRYETYSYVRLYKSTKEVENLVISVNPVFELKSEIKAGSCTIAPYRG